MELFPEGPQSPATSDEDSDSPNSSVSSADSDEAVQNPKSFNSGGGKPSSWVGAIARLAEARHGLGQRASRSARLRT